MEASQVVFDMGLAGNNRTQLTSIRERAEGLAWSLGHDGLVANHSPSTVTPIN